MAVSAAALIGLALAGCSADTARFSDNSLGNPYASRGNAPRAGDVTGSVRSNRVESRPLPQAQGSLPPPLPRYSSATGTSGGGARMASYPPKTTGSLSRPEHRTGGTTVTVDAGETVNVLARRYHVSAAAILHENNIADGSRIRPGQRLVIPHHGEAVASTAPAPHAAAPAAAVTHTILPGESLNRVAHKYGKSAKDIAAANKITTYAKLKAGDTLIIPGVRTAQVQTPAAPAIAAPKVAAVAPPRIAAAETTSTAHVVSPASEQPTGNNAVKAANTGPGFRWPVHGRVITAFGPKTNGQQNDGINVSVPEGTPVKAAEDGVVAYAGNELKGYGNLVLVRHANGYVTAYAHASELLVKRGDQVKRGQIIAKSGATGNVTAPQLHFEVRRGATPVDPMPFLGG